MAKVDKGRGEIRDYYEGQGIDMSTAKDCDTQLETPAKDSPAMTGESSEETKYNSYSD